ncbi:hypothetical protein CRM22_007357 [Opisthorchis felineus]|uniref:Uncharacterized protein n=1 Tax=Opisthorchis felineus TaxID=147828 RepID=A0A4S2LGA3_OPIFE|nr:hypothetical protein CRM22_007357 [Opisthorchis felineus]
MRALPAFSLRVAFYLYPQSTCHNKSPDTASTMKQIFKPKVFLMIGCLVLLFTMWMLRTIMVSPECSSNENLKTGQLKMHYIRRNLIRAFRASRSSEARLLIEKALLTLGLFETESDSLPDEPNPLQRPEVCPEYWGDLSKDKVYFENIYKTETCDRIPLEELVEILLYADTCTDGKYLVDRIRLVYPNIHIQMALGTGWIESACSELPNVHVYIHAKDNGVTWEKLSRFGPTKYLLIGRNMVDFTHYTDIDRMLRVMNSLQVDVVGGAVRLEPEGQWYPGCYQSTLRNFTLRIHPGYDLSAQSCAYCDYIASPFLVRRRFFQTAMQSSTLSGPVAFVQMFLDSMYRTGVPASNTVACADVLFHVAGKRYGLQSRGISETPKSSWFALAKQWVLNRIVLPGGFDYHWTCDEVNIDCEAYKHVGVVLPGCCIEELARCLKGFLTLAFMHNVSAFPVGGTLLGPVKFDGGFLPWERDADVVWDAYKYPIIDGSIRKSLEKVYGCKLGQLVYTTHFGLNISACSEITNNSCIYYQLSSKSWRIELYGDPIITVHRLWGLRNVTKINLNGMWVTAPPNPGRYVRNAYGDNILGHVQHWRDYGLPTGWARYANVENEQFRICPKQFARHSCLRGNYLSAGNIQFQDSVL